MSCRFGDRPEWFPRGWLPCPVVVATKFVHGSPLPSFIPRFGGVWREAPLHVSFGHHQFDLCVVLQANGIGEVGHDRGRSSRCDRDVVQPAGVTAVQGVQGLDRCGGVNARWLGGAGQIAAERRGILGRCGSSETRLGSWIQVCNAVCWLVRRTPPRPRSMAWTNPADRHEIRNCGPDNPRRVKRTPRTPSVGSMARQSRSRPAPTASCRSGGPYMRT